jgi:hypothetical protein
MLFQQLVWFSAKRGWLTPNGQCAAFILLLPNWQRYAVAESASIYSFLFYFLSGSV